MKNRTRKLMAILMALAASSTMMLASCSSGNDSSTSAGNSTAAETGDTSTAEPQGDPYEVVMTYLYWGTLPTDFQMVEDAFNEKMLEKVNAQV